MVYIVIRLFAIVFHTKRRRYTSFFYFDFQYATTLGDYLLRSSVEPASCIKALRSISGTLPLPLRSNWVP